MPTTLIPVRTLAGLAAVLYLLSACSGNPERADDANAALDGATGDPVSMSEMGDADQKGDTDQTPDASRDGDADQTPDADQDGVPEEFDECPDTLSPRPVDKRGCAVLDGVLEGVVFAPGDAMLDADAQSALLDLVAELKAYPRTVVRIEGHTDNRGIAADNLELSKQRVLAVARFLVANGIPASRLKPVGFGESRPRAVNATAEGRELNRRIEIKVVAVLPAES